jgi:hypothetical protein
MDRALPTSNVGIGPACGPEFIHEGVRSQSDGSRQVRPGLAAASSIPTFRRASLQETDRPRVQALAPPPPPRHAGRSPSRLVALPRVATSRVTRWWMRAGAASACPTALPPASATRWHSSATKGGRATARRPRKLHEVSRPSSCTRPTIGQELPRACRTRRDADGRGRRFKGVTDWAASTVQAPGPAAATHDPPRDARTEGGRRRECIHATMSFLTAGWPGRHEARVGGQPGRTAPGSSKG